MPSIDARWIVRGRHPSTRPRRRYSRLGCVPAGIGGIATGGAATRRQARGARGARAAWLAVLLLEALVERAQLGVRGEALRSAPDSAVR